MVTREYQAGRAGQVVRLSTKQESLARELAQSHLRGVKAVWFDVPTEIKRRGQFLSAEASRRRYAVQETVISLREGAIARELEKVGIKPVLDVKGRVIGGEVAELQQSFSIAQLRKGIEIPARTVEGIPSRVVGRAEEALSRLKRELLGIEKVEVLKKKERIPIYKKIIPGIPIFVPGVPGAKMLPISDITKTAFDFAADKGFTKEKIASWITIRPEAIDKNLPFLSQRQRDSLKKLSKFSKGAIIGSLEAIEKEPEKIITWTATSFFAPSVIARLGGTKVATQLLAKVPEKIKRKGAKAVNRFLGGLYLTSTGIEIAGEPTIEEKGKKLGGILTTEVAPFVIGTRLGVKSYLKKELKTELDNELAKLSPEKRAAFKDYMKQAELFGKYEPKAKNIKLNNIESIKDPKSQKVLRGFLKDSKGNAIVGGSVAQTGQVKITRKLGDVDLYLKTGDTKQAAKNLANQLKKAGIERVSSIRGQVTIDGKKAIEFHSIDMLLTNIRQVIPFWQNPNRYIVKTPEGIMIQRIGLQARRKLVAAFADPKRMATGKYRKDLMDFKTIADKLFKKAEINARKSFFFREAKIRRVEKIFKKKITRKPVPTLLKPKKVKRPTIIKKVVVKKPPRLISKKPVKFKEPPILKRAKIKAKQKPFAKLKVKKPPVKYPYPKIKPKKIIPYPFVKKKPPVYPLPKKIPPFYKPPKVPKITYPPIKIPPITYPPIKIPPITYPPIKIKVPPPPPPPPRLKPKKRIIKKVPPIPRPKVKSYDVYGKPIKKRKYVKLNIVPLKKSHAKSLGAYLTDHSLARTYRIKPSPKPAQKPKLKVPSTYFKKTRRKFRSYRIVKGEKIPLKNKWIERRGKPLLDTRSEKRKITLLRKLAQLKKKIKKKKRR